MNGVGSQRLIFSSAVMGRSLHLHREPRTDLIFFPPQVFGTGRKGKSWTISTTGTLDTPGSQPWST